MSAKRFHDDDILSVRKKLSTFRVPFALDQTGHIVSVNNYNGEDKGLTCVECKQALIFRKTYTRQNNVVVRGHFAHTSGNEHHAGESYWHKSAKHILCRENICHNITIFKTCCVCHSLTKQRIRDARFIEEQTWGAFKIDAMADDIVMIYTDCYPTDPTLLNIFELYNSSFFYDKHFADFDCFDTLLMEVKYVLTLRQ